MHHDLRLKWVGKNRTRRDRGEHVGRQIERFVKHIMASGMAEAQEAASIIGGLVDNEFRLHCRVAVGSGTTVVIYVDHPGLVYSMRLRWLSPLREALSKATWRGSLDRIIFEFGTAGVSVNPDPESNP